MMVLTTLVRFQEPGYFPIIITRQGHRMQISPTLFPLGTQSRVVDEDEPRARLDQVGSSSFLVLCTI